jgi:hypothetical protein
MWGFYKDFDSFWRLFQRNWGVSRIARLFKHIFRGIEAFLRWCEAFSKNPRLFKNNLRKMETFSLMLGILKDFEAFKYIFREVEAFV